MLPETANERTSEHEVPTIEAVRDGGDTALIVRGDVDMESAPSLWESVEQAVPGSGRVIVDLRDVAFLDSSGLSVFVRAHRRLGDAFVLRSPNPMIRRLLDLTGLDQVLTIED